uniref:Uncharacterized protein n=1 Tax=Trieres chinensis TaxID=1514140 RepID=A0A7S2AAX5_TRICV|mmetsp:Transcript_9090/g.19272  ORF Transcript_9090/g.19272 Transcript_9090/m.19272 type:complete len:226 (+) Transcript_9090:152-829(+)|eukprot:CAMPEP_0183308978 /NCGR_PEP_ID=MMETSP0160_2-20130417/23309_1 /TAXON_ID=2839 ORGANISM="Odontella Sinensis, Strain Grunow 1884" /NCGR_SAMPLE_ID=MMETSP0160_2 /ASSEMBLY_ACC=CAM_ASM_000250 /LENGTH=225 /DNA_ID=CAMNT_0025472907 /DNA_START=150 /DNA_END=827 /DNA_ORIENTATION=-
MNWFGKKKKGAASTTASGSSGGASDPQVTIVKLRENIAMQEKREEHIQRKMNGMVKEAKEKMARKDKKGAMFALKRKKLYEQELDKIQNVKMTLETQVMNLESASQNAQTFKAMDAGKNAMKKIRTDVGIDKVDDMMDDIREEMEMASEISSAIAQPVDPLLADEDELLAELEELEAEDVEDALLTPPAKTPSINLPAVPSNKLPALANDEAEELKKLEAELAGL